MKIPGYEIDRTIEGAVGRARFRARRVSDGCKVLLEIAPAEAEAATARFQRELEISRYLKGQAVSGIVRGLDVIEAGGSIVLVREDPGGLPLDGLLLEGLSLDGLSLDGPSTLALALGIARQVAEALAGLHHCGFIHRDMRPRQVLVDLETGTASLTGLGRASHAPRQWQGLDPSNWSSRALAYISPEQTGRTHRLVDYRTDLYSLGVTLFEMLTGRLPFVASDPMGLIHAHIARQPPDPCELAADLPEVVSEIVLKLLAKTAEERYQGGLGLSHDLERCLCELKDRSQIRRFRLGERDVPARFELPQSLYGREADLERLVRIVDAPRRREPCAVLVTGSAGVGKTSLMRELRRHVLLRGGLFASGKYNARERGVPYNALLAALRGLAAALSLGEPDRVEFLKQRLGNALGANLGVLVEVVPELEVVVGSVAPAEPLGAVQAKNRFHLCIERLLGVFAEVSSSGDGGLVVFLDDLQWIDLSSLDLLRSVLAPGTGGFMLLGAYRDSEVDRQHPLTGTLAEIRARGVDVHTLGLAPLGPGEVERLVGDTLRADTGRVTVLAELVFRKTAGNPFFVKAFLASLHEEGYLTFDPASGWNWHLDRVAAMEATENVLELTRRKISRLPEEVRRTTALAAALGGRFEVSTLAAVCGLSRESTEQHLITACRERILIKSDRGYQFEHDGLGDSAYGFLPEADRARAHLEIGQFLIRRESAQVEGPRLFDIAEHLNQAAVLLVAREEREDAAHFHLRAGRQARSASAFPAAFEYFRRGLVFLRLALPGSGSWSERYELSLDLHTEAAEAAVLTAAFEEADRLVDVILEHSITLLDAIPAHEARIAAAHARLREEEALASCRQVLALLGVEIPARPAAAEIDRAFQAAHRLIETVLDQDLLDKDPGELRIMTDPTMLVAGRLLIRMATIAGRADPTLGRLIACRLLDLAIEHGHSPPSAFACILIGDLRCNVLGDLEGGYRSGVFGLALVDILADRWLRLVCGTFFNALIQAWKSPLAALCESFAEGHRQAMEDGDFQIAGGNAYHLCLARLLAGEELASVEATVRQYLEEVTRLGQQMYALTLRRLLQVILELQSGDEVASTGPPSSALSQGRGADLNVEVRVAGVEMMARHLLRESDVALRMAVDSEALPEHALPGIPFDFYRCLIFLDSRPEPLADPGALEAYREKVAQRARVSADSYQHKLDLIDALREARLGRTEQALRLFERAIEGAGGNGFVHEQGLACELAAEFCFELGLERIAALYTRSAVAAYGLWGAGRKVADLRRRHPRLFAEGPALRPWGPAPDRLVGQSDALDRISLEQAASALAGELDLHELLEKLLAVLLENAGAQRGYLLRHAGARIEVEAPGSVDEDSHITTMPLESCDGLSHSIVRYVSQSLERIVLSDASRDERFANDPYIVRQEPKSILCAPIVHQGKSVAILYLENNRIPDAFAQERLAAVHLISSQAAVALENARLHHELKREVQGRQQVEEDLRRTLAEMSRLKDRLEAENVYLREEIEDVHDLEEIVGENLLWKKMLYRVEQVAATDATVLVLGETGTGKELIARAVHQWSRRRHRPLVKVNCATLPASLIESELFGHEKGAFTGAYQKKIGRFELADGGTLFLDEIAELVPELQVKLLRILQEGEFERLGGGKTRRVDVRVIAATNRHLEKRISEGTFRADLYYRLTVFPVELPPLRQRKDDIPLFVHHFLRKKQGRLGGTPREVPSQVMTALMEHPWPGNVRELENTIERALILSPGEVLELDGLFVKEAGTSRGAADSERLDDVERAHFLRVLEVCDWKVKGKGNAAERLGLNASTLRFRMKKLGILRPVR